MSKSKTFDWSRTAESLRFKKVIARLSLPNWDLEEFKESIPTNADLIVLRVPSKQWPVVQNDLIAHNYKYKLADELVHYRTDARDLFDLSSTKKQDRDWVIRAEPSDSFSKASFESLLRRSFADYVNHYSVQSSFSQADILSGFVEWGLSFSVKNPGKRLLIAQDTSSENSYFGFLAGEIQGDHFEIILNAVGPESRSRGIYQSLIEALPSNLGPNVKTIGISTQAHNVSVQRVWQRLGFRIFNVESTIHVELRNL